VQVLQIESGKMDLRGYEQNKFAIAEILRSASACVPEQRTELRARLQDLFARLAEDRFNLVVVGRFNRGKTSLMNAILGTDRLPIGIVPLTSVITTVGYGSKERVVLKYANRILDREIPIAALLQHITQQGNPGNVQRMRLMGARWHDRESGRCRKCWSVMTEQAQGVERAIARLKSFRDGDIGLFDVIACGEQAISALRTMLFERERSGLYQARCRAVAALAALGAHEVLIEFLQAERAIADPIERVGEDAVINAAAQALANVRERRVFELLLRLAHRPALTGVIGALGAFANVEAVPLLIDALEEDASRLTAEAALRKLGRPARAALLRAVDMPAPSAERESESSVRRRRSALRLLVETEASRGGWRDLRHLVHDKDAKVAALACKICLARAPAAERADAVRRLIELLAREDWVLREDIEDCLAAHFDSARQVIAQYLNETPPPGEDAATRKQTETVLRRVTARGRP
jgi:Dynamin family